MKKIFFTALFAFVACMDSFGQQDPNYTQYMYNLSVINPAYAGSKESISGGLLYRKQWVNLEGAPSTGAAFVHSPVGNNVGLGLSFINDQVGPVEENNIYADVSYTLNLGGEHKLAFGMKGGASFNNVSYFSQIGNGYVRDLGDVSFSQDNTATYFNVGAGLFYYTNKYYLSLSVPNFLKSSHLDYDGRKFGTESSHYFLTGGYVFDLTPNTKFKPFAMVKSAFNAPVSFDVSTNFLFFEKFEIGATYRYEDSFGGMVNFRVLPSLRIGYAYDYIVSDLNIGTNASHEFMLLFDLNLSKKVSQSPRYF